MSGRITLREMVLCSLFTALIAVGAFIKIPVPVVPFTLQLLFTTLAGLLMGSRLGFFSVAIYILMGLIGVPVFTEGGGLGYIFKPTFGYLLGFAVGSYITGRIAESVINPSFSRLIVASFAGLFFVYLLGLVYCYLISNFIIHSPLGFKALIIYCFLLAIPGDILLCLLSAFLSKRLKFLS
ncbi:MAG: biotin transporter BioY [Synergistaceae bacterium]